MATQVSEAEIQRLLHGVMEQLGIARPRVEYPAHQATNIVGPQSIQGIGPTSCFIAHYPSLLKSGCYFCVCFSNDILYL